MEIDLRSNQDAYESAFNQLKAGRIVDRIWEHDYTVWRPEPDEISNRLGWLDIAERMRARVADLRAFAAGLHGEGFSHALLLGMGGSSLAPEVFRRTFGVAENGLDLAILDSSDPGLIRSRVEGLDLPRTLFVVATKSGGTVETLSFFKHFYNRLSAILPQGEVAGRNFIAITDPGSRLETLASEYQFRRTFLNDPDIGGRYSALSLFGLVPAALVGLDLERLLDHAVRTAAASRSADSDAIKLGAALGAMAGLGRDKLTFFTAPEIAAFGDWVEQLIAESTGKDGRGILPVVGEETGLAADYGPDRLFVEIKRRDDPASYLPGGANQPAIRIGIDDLYGLGGQFFLWEMATAIAGHLLGIQPFDQPNVEAAKILARSMVAAYHESGRLPEAATARFGLESLDEFLAGLEPGEYIVLQAYVTPSAEMDAALKALRTALRNRTRAAVTLGYGPRFLHSTGQLHKGDGGNGRFIQITSGSMADIPIPDRAGSDESKMSFQVLKLAQAKGDYQALLEADPPRRAIHYHLGGNVTGAIRGLASSLAG